MAVTAAPVSYQTTTLSLGSPPIKSRPFSDASDFQSLYKCLEVYDREGRSGVAIRLRGLSRSGKSCRLRWMNYLKPNVKKGKFSKEEEEIILHSHSLLGNRWSAIASKLPGRSDNDVKNYWNTHLKKRAANHILECKTIEKHDIQNNYVDDPFGSTLFVQTSKDDSSSSYNTSSKNHEDEIIVDICSPGTVNDLQYLWNQVFPLENMELIGTTHHQDTSTTVGADIFPYSYNDPTNPCNHDYDTISHLI